VLERVTDLEKFVFETVGKEEVTEIRFWNYDGIIHAYWRLRASNIMIFYAFRYKYYSSGICKASRDFLVVPYLKAFRCYLFAVWSTGNV
jgi:hypothetical protein